MAITLRCAGDKRMGTHNSRHFICAQLELLIQSRERELFRPSAARPRRTT